MKSEAKRDTPVVEVMWPGSDARQADWAWASAKGIESVLVQHRQAQREEVELAAMRAQAAEAASAVSTAEDPVEKAGLAMKARAAEMAWQAARLRPQEAGHLLDIGVADRRSQVAAWCLAFPDHDPAPGVPKGKFYSLTHSDRARVAARTRARFESRVAEMRGIGANPLGGSS